MSPKVYFDVDASGAYRAAQKGHVVIIVDVIDMSTSLETALELGAVHIFGASPDLVSAPVSVNPEKIAEAAVLISKANKSEIIIIGEPRFGSKNEIILNCSKLYNKIISLGGKITGVVPNVGKEVAHFIDFSNKVVIAATSTGGVAFDAAYNAGGMVTVGTVARTQKMKGKAPAIKSAKRALILARKLNKDISVIAASSNSMEDVLAARYLSQLLMGLE